jgi:hypothetical protein
VFGIDEILEVLPAPQAPNIGMTDEEWLEVFATLGTRLPGDFVAFHKRYGEGIVQSSTSPTSGSLALYGSAGMAGLKSRSAIRYIIPARLAELRSLKAKRKAFPVDLYFQPEGILPWARVANGADLCWVAKGENPDAWSVAVLHKTDVQIFPVSAIQFLARFLRGQLECRLLPATLQSSRVIFTPSSTQFRAGAEA